MRQGLRALVVTAAVCAGCAAPDHGFERRPLGRSVDLAASAPADLRRETAAYLASPLAAADAHLVAFAAAHPLAEVIQRPGGCDAWFRGAQAGGSTTLAGAPDGTPPGNGAFVDLRPRLALVRIEIGFLAVRCATDPYAGRLADDLAALAESWRALEAFADAEGLTMPRAEVAALVLPPEPVVRSGHGRAAVAVAKPAGTDDAVLLAVEGDGVAVTGLDRDGRVTTQIPSARGTYLLDARRDETTATLHIDADGPWTLTLRSLGLVRRDLLPGEVSGHGDDVVLVDLSLVGSARAATVDGDAQVHLHSGGWRHDFAGTLPAADLVIVEVHAPGPWTLRTP
jgi:hypothetical protein